MLSLHFCASAKPLTRGIAWLPTAASLLVFFLGGRPWTIFSTLPTIVPSSHDSMMFLYSMSLGRREYELLFADHES